VSKSISAPGVDGEPTAKSLDGSSGNDIVPRAVNWSSDARITSLETTA